MIARALFATALTLALTPVFAAADTLYPATPVPPFGGRALRLGADHRAARVGDLVYVVFNFAVASSLSNVSQNAKQYNVGLAPGTGNAALSFLRFPTSIGGQTGAQSSNAKSGSESFSSSMMATVVNVLPGGIMQISGTQALLINGQHQDLRVSGYVRPEDIDASDSVLSSRVAGVTASFNGNLPGQREGLVRKILDFLF